LSRVGKRVGGGGLGLEGDEEEEEEEEETSVLSNTILDRPT